MYLIVFSPSVATEEIGVFGGLVGDGASAGGRQVVAHAAVEGENGSGGADLRAHVTHRRHARARDRIHARTKVLHDGTRAALDGERERERGRGRGRERESEREVTRDNVKGMCREEERNFWWRRIRETTSKRQPGGVSF